MHSNSYALITGASEGLGKSLAIECAKMKINLVLVALPQPDMSSFALDLRACYHINVYFFETDLCNEAAYETIYKKVAALNIPLRLLINNAGMGSTLYFTDASASFFKKQIDLNITAVTLLSHYFVPLLACNAPSYILNIGSLSSFFYLLKKQVYGGTKAYIYYLSQVLKKELRPKGIYVSVVCPGAIDTNAAVIRQNKRCSWVARQSVLQPDIAARYILTQMFKKRHVIIPGKINRLFLLLNRILPGSVKQLLTNWQMRKLEMKKAGCPLDDVAAILEDKGVKSIA